MTPPALPGHQGAEPPPDADVPFLHAPSTWRRRRPLNAAAAPNLHTAFRAEEEEEAAREALADSYDAARSADIPECTRLAGRSASGRTKFSPTIAAIG